jgi:hypothetical protein
MILGLEAGYVTYSLLTHTYITTTILPKQLVLFLAQPLINVHITSYGFVAVEYGYVVARQNLIYFSLLLTNDHIWMILNMFQWISL